MTKLFLLELLDTSIFEAGFEVKTVGVFFDLAVAERARRQFWHLITSNTRVYNENHLKVRVREIDEGRIVYFDKDPDEESFGR